MFNKHFKPGQKVLIHLTNPDHGDDRIENISAFCQSVENGNLTLRLPYEIDASVFTPDTKMSIVSESLGLGLKARTYFRAHLGSSLLQLRFDGDLQFFQRRPSTRLNIPIGIRYSRSNGDLRQARQQWQQHIHKLANIPPDAVPKLPSGTVNLSSGGIRLGFKTPIDRAQLCLLLLQLEADAPPICTMAEVVWSHLKDNNSACTAGLQFMGIMAEDQKRLEKFIRATQLHLKKQKIAANSR